MSRIPLSPGVKERVSANVGRIVAPHWFDAQNETILIANALETALAIEVAITEALAVDTAPTSDGKPF